MLVVWDTSNGRRAYLPRLGEGDRQGLRLLAFSRSDAVVRTACCHAGSCICHIAVCTSGPSRVAVSLADNVVRVVRSCGAPPHACQHTRMRECR